MKALIALLGITALAAVVLGGSGAVTWLVEQRLATLAPGGVEFDALHYNPLTGALRLTHVSARDATGREMFRADDISAVASAADVLAGAITLQRVRVASPRLVVPIAPVLQLIGVGGSAGTSPIAVNGLVVTKGALVLQDAAGGEPLELSDVTVRADRVAAFRGDGAFAAEMALYGARVRLTGQRALGAPGYAVHVQAIGVDAVAALRDFPALLTGTGVTLASGRADVDGTLLFAPERLLVSGQAKLERVLARFADRRLSPFSASAIVVGVDRWDIGANAGRISRLELRAPRLSVSLRRGMPRTLTTLLDALGDADIVLRRVRVVDGLLTLDAPDGPVTMRGLTLALQARERLAGAGFVVTGRAGVGAHGRVTVEGSLSRDFRQAEGAFRAGSIETATCTLVDATVKLPSEPTLQSIAAALATACASPQRTPDSL
ncbi:MAG TPA: hypothetical protein VHZ49_21940 [Methylomirabilota bacterium]|nr:hypothetical protein [Methylomirabilota bacterium]